MADNPSVTDQINDWIDHTGSYVISVSPPGYHLSWLDSDMVTKSIIIGVVVLYRTAAHTNDRTRPTDTGSPRGPGQQSGPTGPDIPELAPVIGDSGLYTFEKRTES